MSWFGVNDSRVSNVTGELGVVKKKGIFSGVTLPSLSMRFGSSSPCRSQPAGDGSPDAMPVNGHDSLAGKLLQRQTASISLL
jgi:hypothetical protein